VFAEHRGRSRPFRSHENRCAGGALGVFSTAEFGGNGMRLAFGGTLFAARAHTEVVLTLAGGLSASVSIDVPEDVGHAWRNALPGIADAVEQQVAKALGDLGEATKAMGDVEVSVRGIGGQVPTVSQLMTKEITEGVRASVEKVWPIHTPANWPHPAKNEAIQVGLRVAKPYLDVFTQLETEGLRWKKSTQASADHERLRQALESALNRLARMSELKIDLNVPGLGKVTVFRMKVLGRQEVQQLVNVKKTIDKLPETSTAKVNAQAAYERLVDKHAILDQVRHRIVNAEVGIPEIHSLGFETDLGPIEPRLMVEATVTYGNETYHPRAVVDLGDLASSVVVWAEGFADALTLAKASAA
jgi:hypothetical protein